MELKDQLWRLICFLSHEYKQQSPGICIPLYRDPNFLGVFTYCIGKGFIEMARSLIRFIPKFLNNMKYVYSIIDSFE